MKFAYLFLILTILSMPAFANNSKYDVDLQYAAANFSAEELDEYFAYQKHKNPVYHGPSDAEISKRAREIVKKRYDSGYYTPPVYIPNTVYVKVLD